MSLEVVQSNSGAGEGADVSEDNFKEELPAGEPAMYMVNRTSGSCGCRSCKVCRGRNVGCCGPTC